MNEITKTDKHCSNTHCCVEYDQYKNEIFARDLVDMNNEPAFYTKTKRNVKKAWQEIQAMFDENTRFNQVWDCCSKHEIRTHYWCMVD